MDPGRPEAFEIPARLGDAAASRRAPQPRPGKGGGRLALVCLLEGRLQEALNLTPGGLGVGDTQRAVAMRGVLCYLTGRCAEAERMAVLLMAPQALVQPRLEGEAPATGLGALQRAARPVMTHASYAVGLALLGHLDGAAGAWREAQAEASRAGLPGLLDVDRVLLGRVASAGPWSDPRPPHSVPPPAP